MSRKRRPGRPKGSYKKNDNFYDDDDFAPLLSTETKRGIAIIFFITLSVLTILSLLDGAGLLGENIKNIVSYLFGGGSWLFPTVLLAFTYLLIIKNRSNVNFVNYLGLLLLVLSFTGLLHLRIPLDEAKETIATGSGGGYLGLSLSWPLQKVMGSVASWVVLIALFLISLLLTFNTSLRELLEKSLIFGSIFRHLRFWGRKEKENNEPLEKLEEEEYEEDGTAPSEMEKEEVVTEEGEKNKFATREVPEKNQPTFSKKYKKIVIPLDLFADQKEKPLTAGDVKSNQEKIAQTLQNFGINVTMGDYSIGPTVTQYTFKPNEGVKLSQITTLHNDLALALAAHPIRIEAPIPNKSLVGIEVPNQSIATVGLKDILKSKEFGNRKSNLSLCLGKDVAGASWVANLDKMPHLLIAGATGSGKTVCINSVIISLLYQNSPNTLRLILVDPKRVELPVYNGIPHLLTPVITDTKKTINALKWIITEMDRRFELLAQTGHRDIKSFNTDSKQKMPYLVLIIDELADLMLSSGAEVEGYIIRLAQLARAVGIHLILATQRPSVNVITGLIKANITSRIAFAVASGTDSRTILDFSGAEKLLGRGDMLYISADLSKPKRIQGVFVSDDEIRRVVEYIKGQNGEPEYDISITEKQTTSASGLLFNDEDGDEYLEEAKDLVIKAGKASASYLQRRLKIGYARAARILDLLEEQGVIGPGEGAKPREVLVNKAEEDYDDGPTTMTAGDDEEENVTEETEDDLEENEEDVLEEDENLDEEIEEAMEEEIEGNEDEEEIEEEVEEKPKKTNQNKINDDELI